MFYRDENERGTVTFYINELKGVDLGLPRRLAVFRCETISKDEMHEKMSESTMQEICT